MASQRKYLLPVHVSEDVLEKNPKFSQLLKILSSKLTADGVTLSTKKEMETAEKNISLARQGWLMNHIPYYELRELVTEMEVKSLEGSLSLEEEQIEVLSEAMSFSELGDYLSLPSSPSKNPTLMGLTLDDLDRHNPTKHHLPALQQSVVPMLEERLLKKCKELLVFFTAGKESELKSDEDWVSSLPSLVQEKKQQLTREKASLKMLQAKRRESFLSYYQTLLQCLSSMNQLIGHHKLEIQSVSDQLCVDWMEAWCVAVCTRAKLQHLQLGCDAYTPRTVSTLKVIRGHLDKAIKETERELEHTRQQVGAYRSVGVGFKSLVDQYTVLKKEIDDCSWGLQQFAQHNQNTD